VSAMKLAPPATPPPPPLPPPPGPPPTQHVLVNFPPELVDKFTPHGPAWLTGPVATLLAAFVALVAAGIAFSAVSRQINANARVVAAQIAADRSERRRAERIDLATDGATLVTNLAQIAFNHEHYSGETGGSPSPNQQQLEFEKLYGLEVLATTRRMTLLGMPVSSEAVEAVYEQARIVIDSLPSDEPADASTVAQKRDHALSVLKSSLEQEVTPAALLPKRTWWAAR
jgi:hypothetical protein